MKYFKLLIYTLGSLVFLSSCNLGNPPRQDHVNPSFGADIHSFSSQGNFKAPNVPFPLSMCYAFIKTLVNNRQQVYSPVTDGHWPAGLGSSDTTPLSVFLSDDLIRYIHQLELAYDGELYLPFSSLTDTQIRNYLQDMIINYSDNFHINFVNDQAAANVVIGITHDHYLIGRATSVVVPSYGRLVVSDTETVNSVIHILHLNTNAGNNYQAGVLFNSTSSSYSLGYRIQLYVDQVSPQFARNYRYTSILIARYILSSIMESIGLSPYINNNETLHPPSELRVPYEELSSPTIVQDPNDIHDMFNYIRDTLLDINPLVFMRLRYNLLSINQTDMNSIRRLLRWPELNNRISILHFAPGSSSNNTLMGACFSSSSSSNTSLNHGVKGDMDGSICFEINIPGLKYTASDLKGNASFQYPLLDLAEANPQDITTKIGEIAQEGKKYERVRFSIKPKPLVPSDFFGTILFQDPKFPEKDIYTGTDGHFEMSKFGPYKVSCSFASGEVPNFDKLDCSIKYNDEEVSGFEGTINGTSINFPVTTSPDKINFSKPVSSLSKIKDSENIMIYPTGSDTFALIIGGSDPIGFKGTLGSVHSGKGFFSPPSS